MPDRTPYLPESRSTAVDADARERSAFYSSKRWADHRKAYLDKHPLCERCRSSGQIKAARIVHHKIERLDDPTLAWAWSNFEALCSPCHTAHHKRKSM
jgi:5-methylcytosine-specific restriction enzyme A